MAFYTSVLDSYVRSSTPSLSYSFFFITAQLEFGGRVVTLFWHEQNVSIVVILSLLIFLLFCQHLYSFNIQTTKNIVIPNIDSDHLPTNLITTITTNLSYQYLRILSLMDSSSSHFLDELAVEGNVNDSNARRDIMEVADNEEEFKRGRWRENQRRRRRTMKNSRVSGFVTKPIEFPLVGAIQFYMIWGECK